MRKAICFLVLCLLISTPTLAERAFENYPINTSINSGSTLTYSVVKASITQDGYFDAVIRLTGRGGGHTITLEDFVLRSSKDGQIAYPLFAEDAVEGTFRLEPGQTLTVPGGITYELRWCFVAIPEVKTLEVIFLGDSHTTQITEVFFAKRPDVTPMPTNAVGPIIAFPDSTHSPSASSTPSMYCNRCDALGDITCWLCRGDKTIYEQNYYGGVDPNSPRRVQCTVCRGTGKTKCDICGGTKRR